MDDPGGGAVGSPSLTLLLGLGTAIEKQGGEREEVKERQLHAERLIHGRGKEKR